MTTKPIPPDPYAYGIVAVLTAVCWALTLRLRGEGRTTTLVAALLVLAAFALLFEGGRRKYKSAMESWRLLERAAPVSPDPYSIYTIVGTVSMRGADGQWIDIGEGAGTFHIQPPKYGPIVSSTPLKSWPPVIRNGESITKESRITLRND